MADYDVNTALVVVDVQNDFASPDGSLYVQGGEKVVPFINDEIRKARDAGATVLYTQDWHPPSTPHFEKDGGRWPVHCVQDSEGAAFYPELDVDGPVVRKGTGGEDGYSGFTVRDPDSGEEEPTDVERLLRERYIKRVVVAGLAQDYCVKETALDAARLGFTTTVLSEGTRAVNMEPGDEDEAYEEMRSAGVTVE